MKLLRYAAPICASLVLAAPLAQAVPIVGASYTFATSVGTQPSNVGVVTITQLAGNQVEVFVDLLPTYGFLNTGGPHTPFAFQLAGNNAGVAASFLLPVGGGTFSLNSAGGENTPYGAFNIAIDSSAGNGSANAYYGDLKFNVSRTAGLTIDDFVANATAPGYFFSADLTNGTNTGAQGWATRRPPDRVPEPGSLALLGLGLVGLFAGLQRRRS